MQKIITKLIYLSVFLCYFFITGQCTAAFQDWVRDVPEKTRFNIPVFEIHGRALNENIETTRAFARELERISGKPNFVDHPDIRKEILLSGKLVPSSNYQILSKFNTVGSQHFIQLRIVQLEDGKILSATTRSIAQHSDAIYKDLAADLLLKK